MELHWQRIAAILVFTALLAQLWVRGIVPSVSHLDTDFPNYLTAAKIVAGGGQVERLYDTPWFREQTRAFGFPEQQAQNSKFDPFPPPTAFVSKRRRRTGR